MESNLFINNKELVFTESFLYHEQWYTCFALLSSQQPCETDLFVIPIWQMRKFRHRGQVTYLLLSGSPAYLRRSNHWAEGSIIQLEFPTCLTPTIKWRSLLRETWGLRGVERSVRMTIYRFWVRKFGLGNLTLLPPFLSSVRLSPTRERGPVSRESRAEQKSGNSGASPRSNPY